MSHGMVSQHMGDSDGFWFGTVENNQIVASYSLPAPEHHTGVFPKIMLKEQTTDVLVGRMGRNGLAILRKPGVNVYVGVPETEPQAAAEKFLRGELVFVKNPEPNDDHPHHHDHHHSHDHGHDHKHHNHHHDHH